MKCPSCLPNVKCYNEITSCVDREDWCDIYLFNVYICLDLLKLKHLSLHSYLEAEEVLTRLTSL